jgi:co-chaperonin GroES (HSP10)
MAHTLRPLGSRILVKPDAPVEQTASGFYIPEAYQHMPAMSGVVQALGVGPERDQRIRVAVIARCVSIIDELADTFHQCGEFADSVRAELGRYRAQTEELGHLCEVGQRVVFPMEAGHEIILNEATDDAVVVLTEDQVIGVCEEVSA